MSRKPLPSPSRCIFVGELPTVLGNVVGGLTFVGATLYSTHYRTAPKRNVAASTSTSVASSRKRSISTGESLETFTALLM